MTTNTALIRRAAICGFLLILVGSGIVVTSHQYPLWPHIRWEQDRLHSAIEALGAVAAVVVVGMAIAGLATRWYLASTTLEYDLDKRLLSLEVPDPYGDVVVYRSREEVPRRPAMAGTTLERVRSGKVLRVGYHSEHLPYSFRNQQGHLRQVYFIDVTAKVITASKANTMDTMLATLSQVYFIQIGLKDLVLIVMPFQQ